MLTLCIVQYYTQPAQQYYTQPLQTQYVQAPAVSSLSPPPPFPTTSLPPFAHHATAIHSIRPPREAAFFLAHYILPLPPLLQYDQQYDQQQYDPSQQYQRQY